MKLDTFRDAAWMREESGMELAKGDRSRKGSLKGFGDFRLRKWPVGGEDYGADGDDREKDGRGGGSDLDASGIRHRSLRFLLPTLLLGYLRELQKVQTGPVLQAGANEGRGGS